MSRLAATQVLSFPAAPDRPSTDAIESLRARCKAAEDSARAAAAAEAHAREELRRVRQICQQMLDATALEILELKRELQKRAPLAAEQPSAEIRPVRPAANPDDEIPFDEIEAVLAASPL